MNALTHSPRLGGLARLPRPAPNSTPVYVAQGSAGSPSLQRRRSAKPGPAELRPSVRGSLQLDREPTTAPHHAALPALDLGLVQAFDSSRLYSMGVPAALQSAHYAVGALLSDVDDRSGTSYVSAHLPLASFLDQALHATKEGRRASPATLLLMLSIISRLRFGSPAAAEPYRALYQRAATALMESADSAGVYHLQHTTYMSPGEVLAYFECAAGLDFAAPVYKGAGLGHLLHQHLRQNRFSPAQQLRLLEAWAALRTRSGYNPCVLNFRLLGQGVAGAAPGMTAEELGRVVAAVRCFEWPVYSSLALLEGVCVAALAGVARGELAQPACKRILEAAVEAAAHYRPAQGSALRVRLAVAAAAASQGSAAKTAAARGGAAATQRGSAPAAGAPANNAVLGPERGGLVAVSPLLRGLTACLPAAALLMLPALPQFNPLAVISALVVVSLVAVSDV